ncbi:MAG TPA: EamA family transporter [Candidatus Eisenbacteria bacterium]
MTGTFRSSPRAVILALAAALLFGASTPLAKTLLRSSSPLVLAGLFYLGAALAVAPASFRGSTAALRTNRGQIGLLGGAVFFGGMLAPVLLLLGLRLAPAASVSLWLTLETVATTVLAWAVFREHVDRRTWAAAALIVAAGALLALPEGRTSVQAGLLVALACVCWGIDNNLTSLVSGYTPAQTTLVKGLAAGAVNLTLGLLLEPAPLRPGIVLPALLVGALSYGVSIVLYISSAQQLGASRSQMVFASSPFLGVLLAWALFREHALAVQLLAGGVMAAGIGLMLTASHEHEHAHEAMGHTHSHRHDDGHHTHRHPGLPASHRHTHPHVHEPLVHRHPHVPDLHHRHPH